MRYTIELQRHPDEYYESIGAGGWNSMTIGAAETFDDASEKLSALAGIIKQLDEQPYSLWIYERKGDGKIYEYLFAGYTPIEAEEEAHKEKYLVLVDLIADGHADWGTFDTLEEAEKEVSGVVKALENTAATNIETIYIWEVIGDEAHIAKQYCIKS